ncbi:hypothetical protein CQW23_18671 [Capsicum baccatum]|uniref:AT-hook motif nuclear-localized protein n=1 Tax=Capsicum baccatum TaxID=33114 RepID=A0A2G2W3K1_CAPBA|nr:hypothetical protein CQW23_18671 [Capsicum baccatum]
MECEFITLDKDGEEAEWLWNFLKDILQWPNPVALSKNNVSDPFTKDMSREGVKTISKGMSLRPMTSQHGDGSVVVVGDTVEPSQKKRGRPRKSIVTKFVVDGNIGVAEPSQKKRGRPRKSVVDGTGVTGATSSKNPSKKDIVSKIMTFLEQERSAVCILSGVGVLCKVILRRSKTVGGTMTRFLNLSVTSPDGSDFGGVVAGKLRVVTLVTLRCFCPHVEKPESKAPSSTPPPIFLNFGPPVTKAGSSSQVPQPTFEGQAI